MKTEEIFSYIIEKFNLKFPVCLKNDNEYIVYFENGSRLLFGIGKLKENERHYYNHVIKRTEFYLIEYLQGIKILIKAGKYKLVDFNYILTEHNRIFSEENIIIKIAEDKNFIPKISKFDLEQINNGNFIKDESDIEDYILKQRLDKNKKIIKSNGTENFKTIQSKIKHDKSIKERNSKIKRSRKEGTIELFKDEEK